MTIISIAILALIYIVYNTRMTNSEHFSDKDDFGFIILRHVNSSTTNKYWIKNYNCIRKYYPKTKILIIDDNSNYEYIKNTQTLSNVQVLDSEFKARGELLPYYYFLTLKPFKKAVIIHDSVFFNKYMDFSHVKHYQLLWTFQHDWDNSVEELNILHTYKDPELIQYYNDKSKWLGCFGGMSVITHDCISKLDAKYKLNKLIPLIDSRAKRMCFERIIACMLQKEFGANVSLLGNIFDYCPWGITLDNMNTMKHLPLIKVWTGR